MIQRIQSIFLLATAILMAVTVFSPLAGLSAIEADKTFVFFPYGISSAVGIPYQTWGVIIFTLLGVILPLVNIFLYKNRKLQMKIGTVTTLCILLFYITSFVYIYSITGHEPIAFENIQYGIILPIIALIFNIMAVFRIKKDEKLVQSLNRIR